MRGQIVSIILFCFSVILSGCSNPGWRDPFAHKRSDCVKGEKVEIELIDANEITGTWVSYLRENHVQRKKEKEILFEVASATYPGIDILTSVVINLAQAGLKEEANRHQRQFMQSIYNEDFWESYPKDTNGTNPGAANYAGFILTRKVVVDGQKDTNAFKLICQLGRTKDNPYLFWIKPMYFWSKYAKSKVYSPDPLDFMSKKKALVAYKIDIIIEGTWIDQKGAFQNRVLAGTNFTLKEYSIEDAKELAGEKQFDVLGYFPAPPVSQGNTKGGAFKLTVIVTEVDESKAKEIFINTADFINKKEATIIKDVKAEISK